jgi:hypothetical protein
MASPTWVIDTSSLIHIRSLFSRAERESVMERLAELVEDGRVVYPREVVLELERYAGADNPALAWAKAHQTAAARMQPSFEALRNVLAHVPEVIDASKEGTEEADPYVLAMAVALRESGADARVVTEEFKTTVRKMPLGSAAGFLGIPSVSIRTMLKFEGVVQF